MKITFIHGSDAWNDQICGAQLTATINENHPRIIFFYE